MWQHAMEQPPFQHVAQSSKPQTVPKNACLGCKFDFYAMCIRTYTHLKENTEIAGTKTHRPLQRKPQRGVKPTKKSKASLVLQQIYICP